MLAERPNVPLDLFDLLNTPEDLNAGLNEPLVEALRGHHTDYALHLIQFNSIQFLFRQSCTIEYNIIYIYTFTIDKPSCNLD